VASPRSCRDDWYVILRRIPRSSSRRALPSLHDPARERLVRNDRCICKLRGRLSGPEIAIDRFARRCDAAPAPACRCCRRDNRQELVKNSVPLQGDRTARTAPRGRDASPPPLKSLGQQFSSMGLSQGGGGGGGGGSTSRRIPLQLEECWQNVAKTTIAWNWAHRRLHHLPSR